MTQTTFLITPEWIIPVIPEGKILAKHSLVVTGERIVAISPTPEARAQFPDVDEITLPDQVLLPGLINVHGHAAMTLLRGYADDRALMDWLNNHIWPVEAKHVGYDYVYDGTSLAIAEMIATGTTCAADTYFFPDATMSAYADQGFRAQVGLPVIQFPNAWAKDEAEHLARAQDMYGKAQDLPHILTALAPHAPYTVTDNAFEQIQRMSEDLDIPIHLHLHETAQEVSEAIETNGLRPFERMRQFGIVTSRLQAVHMTQLLEEEIDYLAEVGAHIAHCPDSNLKLASGFCPVTALSEAGVNVAVGTDGVASNNNLDMFAELRSAALLAKGLTLDATSIPASEALAMGTIKGARLLGIDHLVGSLEVGKLADLVCVDLSAAGFQPVHNPLSQIVYSATGHQVSNVWIAGKQLLKNREFTQLDHADLITRTKKWQEKINLT